MLCVWVRVGVNLLPGAWVIKSLTHSHNPHLFRLLLWWTHHLQHNMHHRICSKSGCSSESLSLQLPTLFSRRRSRTQILSSWILTLEHLHKKKKSTASPLSSHVFGRDLSSHYNINAYWAQSLSEKHFTESFCGFLWSSYWASVDARTYKKKLQIPGQYFSLETWIPVDLKHLED